MRRVKKIPIVTFILRWLCLIMTVVVVSLFAAITILTEMATESGAKQELWSVLRDFADEITLKEGKPVVSPDFAVSESKVVVVILDERGRLLWGKYPEGFDAGQIDLGERRAQRVQGGGKQFYAMDRTRHFRHVGGSPQKVILRGILNKRDTAAIYRIYARYAYLLVVLLVISMIVFVRILQKKLSQPLVQVCNNAEAIRRDLDFSTKLEYDGNFYELDLLTQAHNRLLEQMDRVLRRQNQFSSDVSHELRTPVAVIQSRCQLYLEGDRDPASAERTLEIVCRQSDRMGNMIEQLLNLSRLDQNRQPLRREPCDIVPVVESVCEEENNFQPERRFRYQLEEASTEADLGLLMIAIRNLVSNAMKYSPVDKEIVVRTGQRQGRVYIQVQDQGSGIAPEQREQIFDRFYRGEESRSSQGFGLGLSLAEQIVRRHGGSIEVSSVPGEGSSFTIWLENSGEIS